MLSPAGFKGTGKCLQRGEGVQYRGRLGSESLSQSVARVVAPSAESTRGRALGPAPLEGRTTPLGGEVDS